jgi:hypothetical protein
MKQITNYLAVLLTTVLFASCEKVIDIELEGAAKKYVIEGVLTDQPGSCVVKVSRTKDFDASNSFAGVSGANVTITDGKGSEFPLIEKASGIYQGNVTGVPGEVYTLSVQLDDRVYTATSQMPMPVSLDSLYITEADMMSEKLKLAHVVFRDPASSGNAYRFVQYVNGRKDKNIFAQSDDLFNGRLISANLFTHDSEIKTGDTMTVELQGIDPAVYKYWFSLSQGATGAGESASPANPVSNITGGALGYFSAHTLSTKSILVP